MRTFRSLPDNLHSTPTRGYTTSLRQEASRSATINLQNRIRPLAIRNFLNSMNTPSAPIYEERLTSSRTSALFGLLTVLFLALVIWRAVLNDAGFLSVLFLCLLLMFLFYSLNYRVLHIRPPLRR